MCLSPSTEILDLEWVNEQQWFVPLDPNLLTRFRVFRIPGWQLTDKGKRTVDRCCFRHYLDTTGISQNAALVPEIPLFDRWAREYNLPILTIYRMLGVCRIVNARDVRPDIRQSTAQSKSTWSTRVSVTLHPSVIVYFDVCFRQCVSAFRLVHILNFLSHILDF